MIRRAGRDERVGPAVVPRATSSRLMGMCHTGPLRNFAAALAFAALWLSLSHVHEGHDDVGPHAGDSIAAALHAESSADGHHALECALDSPAHVSSDDDHHEHSSRVALALEACFACRSSHDDELLADATLGRLESSERGRPYGSARDAATSAVLEGLPASRAPPAIS